MEIKQKSKITNIFKIIVFTLILLILILGFSTKANAAELFSEDIPKMWYNIPRYGNIGPLVFCSEKGAGTAVYMDCSYDNFAFLLGSARYLKQFKGFGASRESGTYTVLNEDPIPRMTYNWNSGLGRWELAEKYGPIYSSYNFKNEVSSFLTKYNATISALGDYFISSVVNGKNYASELTYYENPGKSLGLDYDLEGDARFDWDRVHDSSIGLPMINGEGSPRPPLYSMQFDASESIPASQAQAALYINSNPATSDDVSADDYTKQKALWGLKAPYVYNQGKTTGGNWLTEIACMYENMYKKLTELMQKGNMTCGEAYLSYMKSNTQGVKGVEKVNIENKDYDLYVYDKVIWDVNKDEKAYYLGPFSIDYSVVGSSDPRCVAYDYIKDVTVYNQDKKNITELGGNFEILKK